MATQTKAPMPPLFPLPERTQLLGGRYTILKHINSGGSSYVYVALGLDGRRFIIKELVEQKSNIRDEQTLNISVISGEESRYQQRRESFLLDIARLAAVASPFIVGISDFFYEHGTAYIVMPHAHGVTLAEAIFANRQFSEYDILKMTEEISMALLVLRKLDWVHSDIKPGNIFIRHSGSVFLLDFGSTLQKKRQSLLEECDDDRAILATTQGYVSPELSVPGYIHLAGTWSDVYSLGKTMLSVAKMRSVSPYMMDFFYQLCNPKLKVRQEHDLESIITDCQKMMKHANRNPAKLIHLF